jgi:hypothetical protein
MERCLDRNISNGFLQTATTSKHFEWILFEKVPRFENVLTRLCRCVVLFRYMRFELMSMVGRRWIAPLGLGWEEERTRERKEERGIRFRDDLDRSYLFYTGVNRIGSCEPVWFTPGYCISLWSCIQIRCVVLICSCCVSIWAYHAPCIPGLWI